MTRLVPYHEDHLPLIFKWHTIPGMELKLGLRKPPGIRETAQTVDEWIRDPRTDLRMIEHREQIIGYIRYVGICTEHGFCEIHTLVGEKEFLGTKVCVDVMDTAMSFAFEVLGMYRVGTFVLGNNPRLFKTALKYGFKLEGTMRQFILTGSGERIDYHLFGMLKSEFKRRG